MKCVLFAKMDQVFSLKKNIKKILEKWQKYWKSQGILSGRKSGNPGIFLWLMQREALFIRNEI